VKILPATQAEVRGLYGRCAKLNVDHYGAAYTDDSYVVVIEDDIERTEREHIQALEDFGMKVNADKTEIVIFSKKKIQASIKIGNSLIESQTNMKVLGDIFDAHLKWETSCYWSYQKVYI